MISGRNNVLVWFKMQNKPYFSIFRKNESSSGNTVFNNRGRENETIETASAYLDQCLSLMHSGDFFIFCNDSAEKSASKGRAETFFTITVGESAPANVAVSVHNSNNNYSYETVLQKAEEIAAKQFEQLTAKRELDLLKQENAQLKKEIRERDNTIAKPWQKIAGDVSPYIGSILEGMGFAKKTAPLAISGHAPSAKPEENTDLDDAEVQRMNTAVNAFCEALKNRYPNEWLSIIEKLTATINESPGKIDMALKFL